ncbi:MAG: hypothetical protein RL693_2882 [Verrucomicrobiota bacterium]|jgi:hypothetical protein
MDNMEKKPLISSGCLVRLFVGGLPLGLAIMGALSFIVYFNMKKKKETPVASQLSSMLRKDLSADDFERYGRILSQDIGVRTAEKKENLEAASAFVESTLGFDNMGYAVVRQEFDANGKTFLNLTADLVGKSNPKEIVLVVSTYDSTALNQPEESSGLAAMLCLAHSLTGDPLNRTVRYAAVINGRSSDPKLNGLAHLLDQMTENKETVKQVLIFTEGLDLSSLPKFMALKSLKVKPDMDAAAVLKTLQEMQAAVKGAG